jgi:uncharacterized membrane protein YgdD (TMEM256/DUF423 family)
MFIGSLFCFFCVGLGAFAAHGLKSSFSAYQLDIWQTAVFYQFVHSLGLIIIGYLVHQYQTKSLKVAAYCLLTGVVIFSGSLYCLALTDIKMLGALTPIGGILFLFGWASLAWWSFKTKN